MKNTHMILSKKTFLLLTTCLCFLAGLNAQKMKVGYVRMDVLVSNMPEYQKVQAELEGYKGQLSSTLESKYQDYQAKLAGFEQAKDTLDVVIMKDKESELKHLQTSLQEFEKNAQESYATKERSRFEPIEQKLQETIQKVAEEKGYTHITQKSTFIYVKDESTDITGLVAEKLGYTITENLKK